MKPDDWQQVRDVFGTAIALQGAAREGCLAGLGEEVRAEVESLLAANDSAGGFLESGIGAIPPETCVGPYRIERKIGEGGMGEVYLATREEQEFALKLVPLLLSTSEVNRRFLAERYILAGLVHPNIVSLVDSGEWDGRCYLVMEFVSGAPITEFARGLSLPAKLGLFRSLASAIHYAHQNLVVHRDLKPANVLVSGDGVVKVLDFGIARLLDAATGSSATTQLHPMSLDCASPEQVRGQPITTASDIYSLGVLLYEILTGVSPQGGPDRTLDETVRCICETAPPRPSAVNRSIPADLDSIVLRAIQKEPSLRYHSAEELAADIERFLRGAPVMAREATLGYVARKYIARHRVAFAAGAVAVLLLAIASGAAFWQSRVASRERTLAQRRFEETRKLARSVIFDLQEQLAKLPGTLPVRQQMIVRTLTYLESMARDAAGNPELVLDIAGSYLRVGEIQSRVGTSNLGDSAGAVRSWETSLSLLDPLLSPKHPVPEALRLAAVVHENLGSLELSRGNKIQRTLHYDQAAALARRFRDAAPASSVAAETMSAALFYRALGTDAGAPAIRAFEEALAAAEAILHAQPTSDNASRNVALCCKYLSSVLVEEGGTQRALEYAARAQTLDETRLAKSPNNRAILIDVSNDLASVGNIQVELGRAAEAIPLLRRNLELRQRLAREDSADALIPERLARAHLALGAALFAAGNYTEAQQEHLTSMTLLRKQLAAGPAPHSEAAMGIDQLELGEIARMQKHEHEACALFVQAQTALQHSSIARAGAKALQREIAQVARDLATCK